MNHFSVSVIKSGFRITGCAVLMYNKNIMFFASMFLIAELLGVLEEFADKRKEGGVDNED